MSHHSARHTLPAHTILLTLSDPLTGYTLKFEIYSGKGQLDNSITSLYERILCDYFEKGHTIYMDRFYTSPLVLKFLWEKKMA
jgi:hypothetical protein